MIGYHIFCMNFKCREPFEIRKQIPFQIGAEAMGCRTAAAIFNLNSFCKLSVSGPDAAVALDWICTNDVNQLANTYASHRFRNVQ